MSLRRRVLSVVITLVLCLSFVSCDSYRPIVDLKPTPSPTVTKSPETVTLTPVPTQAEPDRKGRITVDYYTVNVSNCSRKNAMMVVESLDEITPDLLIESIIDTLSDQSVLLDVDSISLSDGVCIVSFSDRMREISEDNTELEDAILDACATSIIDNVIDCSSIVFRIEGEAYETVGHSFDIDFVYMTE